MDDEMMRSGGALGESAGASPCLTLRNVQRKPRRNAGGAGQSARQEKTIEAEMKSPEASNAHAVPVMSPVSQRRVPDDADLGWAAGVMDGEGCAHIAKQTWGDSGRRPTYRMRVQIAQNDLTLLREFEWCVGIAGRVYSPKPTRGQNRTCHSLVYDGVRAYEVLERLVKFLRRKKAQAELAAEYREKCHVHLHSGPNGWPESMWQLRAWYYGRMSDLKRV